ncbi:MAG: cation transporter [Betaproteobacteria bacterium]|uniref:Cation transporter n=1 Tax=Candidatus Proximibacter danicus TaxID=2954365 RepID=A0A9D7K4Q6_9PROT|nr:cation transporter [Candidatus Proximibacter danicus]
MSQGAGQFARQIYVLHKGDGHLRLSLPPIFANPGSARVIEAALVRLPGVRAADYELRGSKLAVHFDPLASSPRQIALVLNGALDAALAAAAPGRADATPTPLGGLPIDVWRERAQQWAAYLKHKIMAAEHALRAQLAKPGSTGAALLPSNASAWRRAINPALINERSIINFANDITAFYLIRVHWDLITKHWLKAPLKYSNAWLTVFYLTFLLVRYRKQNLASQPAALPAPIASVPPPAEAS